MLDLNFIPAFPASGIHSIAGEAKPISSGLVSATEIRNILRDDWAKSAVNAAGTLASEVEFRRKYGIYSEISSGSAASTLFKTNNCANGLWNSDTLGGINKVSLTGLGKILLTGASALSAAIGDLEISESLQALASGLAKSISNTASSIFAILDRALSSDKPIAERLVGLATRLMNSATKVVDLFSGAFDLASKGLLAITDLNPGELISGALGSLRNLAGAAIDSLIGDAAKLINNVSSIAKDLLDLGINAFVGPSGTLNDIANLFGSITGKISDIASGIGNAISKLGLDTLSAIAQHIGDTMAGILGNIGGTIADIARSVVDGVSNTIERLRGVTFIDGEWVNMFSLSKLANFSLASIWSKFAPLLDDNTRLASGALLNGSRLGSNSALGQLLNSISPENAVKSVTLAALLGKSPPITGSFLTSANDGWLGNNSTVLSGISGAVSEACTFNSALLAALSQFTNASSKDIDDLMYALECRRGSYQGVYESLDSSRSSTRDLLDGFKNLLALLNKGNYGDICRAGGC